jgi:hypothetical protein
MIHERNFNIDEKQEQDIKDILIKKLKIKFAGHTLLNMVEVKR